MQPPTYSGSAPLPARRTVHWEPLDQSEMQVVHWFAGQSRHRGVAPVAALVNLLADGWIYLPVAAIVFTRGGDGAGQVLLRAIVAVLVAHLLHAVLKRGLARLRPFERDGTLVPIARALDRYSFPSGHCMTLVCVTTPICHAWPALWPVAAGATVVLGCARLVAAHHYPSDVLAGIAIGLAIGLGVAWPTAAFFVK